MDLYWNIRESARTWPHYKTLLWNSKYCRVKIEMLPIGSLSISRHPIMFHCEKDALLIAFLITINKPKIFNWIYVEGLEIINKLCTLYLLSNPGTSLSSLTMVKSHKKKCQNYFCNRVKCCWNVNFEETVTRLSIEKKWWILITARII